MPIYYFDWKDGVTKQDPSGINLADDAVAISKAEDMVLTAAVAHSNRRKICASQLLEKTALR